MTGRGRDEELGPSCAFLSGNFGKRLLGQTD